MTVTSVVSPRPLRTASDLPLADHSPGPASLLTNSGQRAGEEDAACRLWLWPVLLPTSQEGKPLRRAGQEPNPHHAGLAVLLLPASGGQRLGHSLQGPQLRPGRARPRCARVDPRHIRQSPGHLAGAGAAAGGGGGCGRAARRLQGAAVRRAGRGAAAGRRPGGLSAAGARREAGGLLRPGGLLRRAQRLQPRHPRAPVRGSERGLRLHGAPLQPAGRAAPAAPRRLRQLRRERRPHLEVPQRPGRLAGRPALHRGPRRGGPRGRGRPGPGRQPGQRGERQRGPPARLLRGGRQRPRRLGSPGAGAQGAQEAPAGERVQGHLTTAHPRALTAHAPHVPDTHTPHSTPPCTRHIHAPPDAPMHPGVPVTPPPLPTLRDSPLSSPIFRLHPAPPRNLDTIPQR